VWFPVMAEGVGRVLMCPRIPGIALGFLRIRPHLAPGLIAMEPRALVATRGEDTL